MEMLQLEGSVHFHFISTNKERLTDTFPGYHSGYHNLFRKCVSSAVQAFRLHTLKKFSSTFSSSLMAYWIYLWCFWTFVAMKIPFLDQAINWWFTDRYPRCDLLDGILGARFIFLGASKLLKNLCVFFCCFGNGSSSSFTTLCQPSLLDFFY